MDAGQPSYGVSALTPYLAVRDARKAIEFYGRAFGARQVMLIEEPDGRIGHATLMIGPAMLWSAALGVAFGLSLEDAKTQGLVGERPNGYLGVVNPGSQEAQALTNEVNAKRRQAYQDIASRNKTQLQAVEALAGEKAIQNTKQGHFVEGPGGWTRK